MNLEIPDSCPSIILGGGPAGLGIAHRLLSYGQKAFLLEKQDRCGGLSKTDHYLGCKVDLGPHIFHTDKQHVIDLVAGLLNEDLVPRQIKVRVYSNGQFVPYPIKGMSVITALDSATAIHAVFDLLLARLGNMIHPASQVRSFEEWIIRQFGRTIYRCYFESYAGKVWKLSPREISSYVAIKRVPVFSIMDYIRKHFHLKPRRYHSEDQDFVRVFYPRHGIGQLMDRMTEQVIKNGGRIQTESDVAEITLEGSKIVSILYKHGQEIRQLKTDFVFSTIPITSLIACLRPAPPGAVLRAAAELQYNAGRFLYVAVKKEYVFEAALTYFQNQDIEFNRVYSLRHLSVECVPSGQEVLCIEFTCKANDSLYRASDEELFRHSMGVFEKLGILQKHEVAFYFSRKADYAYPVFRVDYEKNLEIIFTYLQSIHNLMVLGRQGLFCYANIDDVIAMGFRSVDLYHRGIEPPLNYSELFKEYLHS